MILSDINVMTPSCLRYDCDKVTLIERMQERRLYKVFLVVVVFFVIAADLFLRVTDVSSSFVHVVGEFK